MTISVHLNVRYIFKEQWYYYENIKGLIFIFCKSTNNSFDELLSAIILLFPLE